MADMNQFLQSLDEKNRRSLELTSDVLLERIQLEALICNLQLRVEEKSPRNLKKFRFRRHKTKQGKD